MARKKPRGRKPPARKKRSPKKRSAARTAKAKATTRARSRPGAGKRARVRTGAAGAGKRASARATRAKKAAPARRRPRSKAGYGVVEPLDTRGLGAEAGGQAGDTEGLSRTEVADSESVEELVEEGQAFEAGIVSGVENAPEPDQGEVRTKEVPQDDVPQEYLDED